VISEVAAIRDFIGYADHPPQFEWPNGGRLALNLALNYEEGAERNRLDGDVDLETLSEATYPVHPDQRDLITESIYEYGSRVGVWRVLDIFDKYQVTATVFASALALERNPNVTSRFVQRDYDVLGHGYRWISHFGLSEEQEREQIVKAADSIERSTGHRPLGWLTRSPGTPWTRRTLAHERFLFDNAGFADDLPYFDEVDDRPFLVLPYSLDINDVRFWKTGFFTAGDFAQYCIDAFDALYRESAKTPRMMSVGLHARIIGRPARVLGLDRFLAHVRDYGDVWISRRQDIANFWAERFGPPDLWNSPNSDRSATSK
jgi:allantoinase